MKFEVVNEYNSLNSKSGVKYDGDEISVFTVVKLLNSLYDDNKCLYERLMSLHHEYGKIHSRF